MAAASLSASESMSTTSDESTASRNGSVAGVSVFFSASRMAAARACAAATASSESVETAAYRSIRRLDGVDRVLLLRRHGAGECLGGRDAGRAGSDEQEYRAGEPHND